MGYLTTGPKAQRNRPNWPWTATSKTESFFFLGWLSQLLVIVTESWQTHSPSSPRFCKEYNSPAERTEVGEVQSQFEKAQSVQDREEKNTWESCQARPREDSKGRETIAKNFQNAGYIQELKSLFFPGKLRKAYNHQYLEKNPKPKKHMAAPSHSSGRGMRVNWFLHGSVPKSKHLEKSGSLLKSVC